MIPSKNLKELLLPLDQVMNRAKDQTNNFDGKPTAKAFLDWADLQRVLFLQVRGTVRSIRPSLESASFFFMLLWPQDRAWLWHHGRRDDPCFHDPMFYALFHSEAWLQFRASMGRVEPRSEKVRSRLDAFCEHTRETIETEGHRAVATTIKCKEEVLAGVDPVATAVCGVP